MVAAGGTVEKGTGYGAAAATVGTGGTGVTGVGYTVGPCGGSTEYAVGCAGADVGYTNGTPDGTVNRVGVDTVGVAKIGISTGAIGI